MTELLTYYDARKLAAHMQEKPVIFQDALDAGFDLQEIEAWSSYFTNLGSVPLTAMKLIDLRTTEPYGDMNASVLNITVERLESELHDDVLGRGTWVLRKNHVDIEQI